MYIKNVRRCVIIKRQIRKTVLLIIFTVLFIYTAISYTVDYSDRINEELSQASYRIGEYLDIAGEFGIDMGKFAEQYFSVQNLSTNTNISLFTFNKNGTFDSDNALMATNRRLFGKGTKDSVLKDEYYFNLAYSFDGFFKEFCEGFPNVLSVSYYSKHDFMYTYSTRGERYLSELDFYTQKYYFENFMKSVDRDVKLYWEEGSNPTNVNDKIMIVNTPVYNNGELEGVISINYSIRDLNQILENNFYSTYIFDKSGIVVASNDNILNESTVVHNVKDKSVFGFQEGQRILNKCFGLDNTYPFFVSFKYYVFNHLICEDFVVFISVPILAYVFGIFMSLFSILFIARIAFWLNDNYENRSEISRELRDKYNELNELKSELEKTATTDFLTKLYNRRYMIDKIHEERLTKFSTSFAILMMDIDHFKSINDTYGHKAGDEVLKDVSSTILKTVRKSDLVARWGGEEILVFIPVTKNENVIIVAEKIRERIEKNVSKVDGIEIKVTISIGVSILPPNESFEKILIQADEALYEAKSTGRNKVVLYEELQKKKKDDVINENNISK